MTDSVFAPWDDPQATPLIEYQSVTKRFGDFTAVDAVDLAIYPGEFFALLGPSGCGKTTLMRMLAGFEDPTEGRITLGGQDVAQTPANKRPVNMMFQSYALFPHMSVWDNIAFGLRREGMAKDKVAARVEEMLRLVQLGKFAKRKPHQISGGQRQRVALARSLAKGPKVLLLDEPLGALDKKLRQETQFELVDIQEKTGTTFMIVTHDQEEAMTVSSRIAVMDEGTIKQIAPPSVLYEQPNSRYTADFVGEINIIEGAVADGTVTWVEGQTPIQVDSQYQGTGWFAVRPEKLNISKEKPEADNVLTGKVIDIGYLGNLSTYVVEIANGQKVKVQMTNARRLSNRDITWEDTVYLSFTRTAGLVLER